MKNIDLFEILAMVAITLLIIGFLVFAITAVIHA